MANDKSRLWAMLDYVMPDYKRYYFYDRQTDELYERLFNRTDLVFKICHVIKDVEENDDRVTNGIIHPDRVPNIDIIPVKFDEGKLLQETEAMFTEAFPLTDVYEVIIRHRETGGTMGDKP